MPSMSGCWGTVESGCRRNRHRRGLDWVGICSQPLRCGFAALHCVRNCVAADRKTSGLKPLPQKHVRADAAPSAEVRVAPTRPAPTPRLFTMAATRPAGPGSP
ncbi:hypothetical protein [Lysobacter gummosus]|uniref:hypothetical protein n=1 Tax=Lysobacter gummosus TaxID=262324 RepID=UPI00363DD9A6